MRNINLRYVEETFDKNGILDSFKIKYPDTFNFGYDIVDDIAVNDPDRRALLWCNAKGEERTFTFADIKRYSDKTANYLTSLGIKRGDKVVVVLKRHYQFWLVATAIHKMGAVLIPATFMLKKHDAEYRINSSSAVAVICTADGDTADAFDEAQCPTLLTKVIVGGSREGWHDYNADIEAQSETWERVETKVTDPFLIYFSSGTSGYPKMVLHDYSYPLGHILTAKHWQCVDPDGLHISIADSGWAKCAWGKIYGQWIMEAGLFVYDFDKFIPGEILSLIGKYKVTTLCCPPTMYRFFLREDLSKYDLSSLKGCAIAGEPLNPDVFNGWKKATGLTLMEGFGQTETTPVICNLRGMTPRPGSAGKPSPQYDVRLVDADGKTCEIGQTGEIVVNMNPRPAGILIEYYRDDARTAEAMRGGWYHTGDTAWQDEDGYYWYVGRNDDIIKSSGYRIGPFEIESVLLHHEAVSECAITGVPDNIRGAIVKATVVLKDGAEASEKLKVELQEYVKRETAPYKYPRMIEFVDALPKTVNGKIRRGGIREKDNVR